MEKLVIKKSVAEEIKKKLESYKQVKNEKKTCESGNFVEKTQNLALTEEKEQKLSKLQESKNIFSRGDFDEYKKFVELENQTIPNGVYECLRYGYYLEPKEYEAQKCKTGVRNTKQFAHYETYKIEDGFYSIIDNEVEKSYTNREFVRGNGKRKDYWRVRSYEGVEGIKQNKKKRIPESLVTKDVKKLHEYIINYRNQMSEKEKKDIDLVIKRGNWSKVKTKNGNTVKVDKRKWHDMESEPLQWEIENASVLADRGFHVYLPKEIHDIQHYKNIDAIVNGVKIEFRYINTNNAKTLQGKYREKLEQNPHVSIHFDEKAKQSPDIYIRRLNGTESSYPKGILICYFEDSQEFRVFDYKMQIKKAVLSTALDRSEIAPPTNINIPQFNNLSSQNITKSLTYSGYKLQGRIKLYGMDISIENKKGTYRSGVDSDGHKWKTLMHYDYGYIRGTVGVDSDFVDCYIGPDKNAKKVYVIHQNNPITHKYDEDKCMLCFESADAAKKAYMKQYDRPGFFGSMETLTVEQFKTFVFSKQGNKIHKSFIVEITDITENNKHKKVEQVEKALNAIYKNKPFVVEHISNKKDFSKKYNNVSMHIRNFDKNKIEKAVHSLAFTLDTKVHTTKGEAFVYASQEDLTNLIVNELTEKTKKVYNFLINFFDLPEITVVRKANLTHKGKVIYNPETGKPIQKSEWEKFVKELEKILNKNYNGIGEKIVLKGEALGIILDRLAKTNSLEEIKKIKLNDLQYKRKHFDWISESTKNLKDVIGETISRDRAARIEVAMQSTGQRIAKIQDTMKNDIQQIIVDGIKNKQSRSVVSQNLFDKCVGLNRDFQKIADSEIQNTVNNAYIKEEVFNSEEGEKVYFKRFEVIDDNTCPKCKKIWGKIVLYSKEPLDNERIKDPYADYAIWEGKTDGIVPIGIVHPYCRGTWVRYYPEYD